MKSIMQDEKVCFICGASDHGQLDEHHCFEGTANRKLSEKYGLKIWVCHTPCHMYGAYSIHDNKEVRQAIKRKAQRKFEETYPDLDFRKIFGRNYL